MQVGFAEFDNLGNGTFRAGVWNGTAESWVDLGALVPAGFSSQSLAYGIWTDDLTTYVSGFGYNVVAGREEALLWTLIVPEPGALALLSIGGVLLAGRGRRVSQGKAR
jgi:hypothetical protein